MTVKSYGQVDGMIKACVGSLWVNFWRARCRQGVSSWQEEVDKAGGLGLAVTSKHFGAGGYLGGVKVGGSSSCPFLHSVSTQQLQTTRCSLAEGPEVVR